jgi:hypothetical protein
MRTVLAMLALLIPGCAGAPGRLTDSPVPPDFALVVLDWTHGSGALFIVEPDGVFRAATGAEPGVQRYPPATRRLSAGQMASVWEAASAVRDRAGTAGGPVAVELTAGGSRRSVRLDPAADAEAGALVGALRRLAWLDE